MEKYIELKYLNIIDYKIINFNGYSLKVFI